MDKKTYCFDIDGTICTNTNGTYEDAKPLFERISKVNELYDRGHTIILFTARGSTTNIDWTELTRNQMVEWGVKNHKILLGKPFADIYIDDKAVNDKDWFKE